MTIAEQKRAAREFKERWKGKGYEKGQSQVFWIDLLENVLGIPNASQYIEFESQVLMDKSTGFMDGYIAETKVLIEQKSIKINLRAGIRQPDGSLLSPFQQAKKYIVNLPYNRHPRWVVTSNFKSFLIYDMNKPNSEPEEILLEDLDRDFYRLEFMVNKENEKTKKELELSIKAGDLVGELYDLFLAEYRNPSDSNSLKSLNKLCVRIVFCLYAEDAGLFGRKSSFHDYLSKFNAAHMRRALIDLFEILNTPEKQRSPYLEEDLAQFPYVNGNLFEESNIEIPQFTDAIRSTILARASDNFNWSEISPTIFGAVFESTLNPETRRSGGMHYTSIENIHKVIDPLFLNDLKNELAEIKRYKNKKTRDEKLRDFQKKLASFTFLDPACGSGNFLTETYLSLRRLENEAIETIAENQIILDTGDIIKVDIHQFYGIEINDFAVSVATTALWIAESQMVKETESIVNTRINFLPLKDYNNIHETNALKIDWEDVISAKNLNYIIGNPPFLGYKLQSKEQKEDLLNLFDDVRNIDYVAGWYKKSAQLIKGTKIEVALVSTNSITQGEQVNSIWKTLIDKYNIKINFAHRSFKWTSDATNHASVYVVIIGFASFDKEYKYLFECGYHKKVSRISPYLIEADNIIIQRRGAPLSAEKIMISGSEARDGGHLLLSAEEKEEVLSLHPYLGSVIKRYITADHFINNGYRYCLWLKNADISELQNNKFINERLTKCSEFRKKSKQKQANSMHDLPYLFVSERQPNKDYLLVPSVSSENRKYVPIGYMDKDVVVSNTCFTIEEAPYFLFSILTSNVHNAWIKTVSGRLEMRYSYSNTVVYNNFPFPNLSEQDKKVLNESGRRILEARKLYSDKSLADLYNLFMPVELRNAHQANDRLVMEVYGFNISMTEAECVAELMKMYDKISKTDNL